MSDTETRPTPEAMEGAMSVLLWLHEVTESGAKRDDISMVRHLLDERIDDV